MLPLVGTVVPAGALLLVSVVRPEFLDRYLAPATPMVALALGSGVLSVSDRVGAWTGRHERPAFAAVGVVVAFALLAASQPAVSRGTFEDWSGATRYVAAGARPGDGLILYSQFDRPPFEAAWSQTRASTRYPRWSTTSAPGSGRLSAPTTSSRRGPSRAGWRDTTACGWSTAGSSPASGRFMFFTGIQGKFRLARRTTVSVPDWGVDVTLYVRKGSPADTSP